MGVPAAPKAESEVPMQIFGSLRQDRLSAFAASNIQLSEAEVASEDYICLREATGAVCVKKKALTETLVHSVGETTERAERIVDMVPLIAGSDAIRSKDKCFTVSHVDLKNFNVFQTDGRQEVDDCKNVSYTFGCDNFYEKDTLRRCREENGSTYGSKHCGSVGESFREISTAWETMEASGDPFVVCAKNKVDAAHALTSLAKDVVSFVARE